LQWNTLPELQDECPLDREPINAPRGEALLFDHPVSLREYTSVKPYHLVQAKEN
jgi:hypothetical protein